MRRTATLLGALAAAGTMTLLPAAHALASTGTLNLNGQAITDPSGCYNSVRWPLMVGNATDSPVMVFSGPNCAGALEGAVRPGQSSFFEFGSSVMVPAVSS